MWKSLNFYQKLTIGYLLGNDHIQNYCLKAFPSAHRHVTENFNAIMQEPEKIPDCLIIGITNFLIKSGDSKDVRNY